MTTNQICYAACGKRKPGRRNSQFNLSKCIARARYDGTYPRYNLTSLTTTEVELIANSLMGAKRPVVITSYLGRNHNAPALLAELCDKLPITVVEMVGSDVSLRSDHEAYRGVTVTTHPEVLEADVILILDCDVPWIPTAGKPRAGKDTQEAMFDHVLTGAAGTKIFHLDVDPLKQQMPRKFPYRPQG